eukprot:CAMPEP_0169181334 /NCGR_PEP_ID=MMETSP1015-20121227/68644_1 /TAXON_ID=342587 /ORGANISM="Karlodinium micrum, Strain CCMP2283" /LENGTH=52 /DNA_ID=CAMNT_0009256493 /DNA_START=270 /DNA_END=428 /DNA_ORIENTATION=-
MAVASVVHLGRGLDSGLVIGFRPPSPPSENILPMHRPPDVESVGWDAFQAKA